MKPHDIETLLASRRVAPSDTFERELQARLDALMTERPAIPVRRRSRLRRLLFRSTGQEGHAEMSRNWVPVFSFILIVLVAIAALFVYVMKPSQTAGTDSDSAPTHTRAADDAAGTSLPTETVAPAQSADDTLRFTATPGPLMYVVRERETLQSIMFRYQLPYMDPLVDIILELSNLESEEDMVAGMTLLIPIPPVGYDKPHPTEPDVPCWEGTFVMEWHLGDPYLLTESGAWIPCTEEIASPTPDYVVKSIDEVSAEVGFAAWEFASVPFGFEIEVRDTRIDGEYRYVGTTYLNRTDKPYKRFTFTQSSPSRPLDALVSVILPHLPSYAPEPQEIRVNGEPALYFENKRPLAVSVLIWNQDGFSFWIVSQNRELDELIALAESAQ